MKLTKKTKRIGIIVSLILIGILGIYFLGGFNKTLSTIGSYQCSGGTIMSVGDVSIHTNDNLGGKKVIRVTLSTASQGECLWISLKPADINSKLSDAEKQQFEATNTVLGDIKLIKQQKIYNVVIKNNPEEVFRNIGLEQLPGYNALIKPCLDSNCRNSFPTTFSSMMYSGSIWTGTWDKCVCGYDGPDLGRYGEFSSSTAYKWETQINIDGQTGVLTDTKLRDTIGNIADAQWGLNGLSNNNLESIGYGVFQPVGSINIFRMIELNSYTRFKDRYTILRQNLVDCDTLFGQCESSVDSAYGYVAELNGVLTDKKDIWEEENKMMVKDSNFVSNQLVVDLSQSIVYPVITIDIDASKVGIFQSSGIPEVTCPQSSTECLNSGFTKDVTINLKNIASETGSFDYTLECNKGSQVVFPSPPLSIGSQQSTQLTARLGLVTSGTSQETSSCIFTARGRTDSDSCSFTYCSKPYLQCTVGTKTCEMGNTELWTCLADGSYNKLKCKYGCWYNDGVYSCRGEDDKNDTGKCESCIQWASNLFKSEENKCTETTIIQTKWYSPFTWINLLGFTSQKIICPILLSCVFIVGLFTVLFGLDLLEKFRSLKGRKKFWNRFVIVLVIALILSYVTYVAFWLGILFFAIFIILKFTIKKFIPMS